MAKAIELFYSYAHKDETLRKQLDTHLSMLRREGLINQWHDRKIIAGSSWAEEIDAHLKSANIILLLVSPDFMASEYCYGIEMQKAIIRQVAGDARVIPVILRPCDWETAPIGRLQALPKDAKAVTMWSNRDAAFTDIVKSIRAVINELNGNTPKTASQATTTQKRNIKAGKSNGGRNMSGASATLSTTILKRAIDRYYKELDEYKGRADYELALRSAFQNLLADTARQVKWTLIPEQQIDGRIRPDSVIRDAFFPRGYWEAKGPKSDLRALAQIT